jgi:hypothetical protein
VIAALLQGLAVVSSVVLFQMVQPAMGLTDRTWDAHRPRGRRVERQSLGSR